MSASYTIRGHHSMLSGPFSISFGLGSPKLMTSQIMLEIATSLVGSFVSEAMWGDKDLL